MTLSLLQSESFDLLIYSPKARFGKRKITCHFLLPFLLGGEYLLRRLENSLVSREWPCSALFCKLECLVFELRHYKLKILNCVTWAVAEGGVADS